MTNPTTVSEASQTVIIDTDIGTDVDDALAVLLALASPELRVRAFTLVHGDVAVRGRILRRMLWLAGRSEISVYEGRRAPLRRSRGIFWLGHEGKALAAVPGSGFARRQRKSAVPALVDILQGAEKPISLITIGPLTNIAAALIASPELARKISRITAMAGNIRPLREFGGVVIAEHNLRVDPEAADLVFRSGIPITMVPLDVTMQVFLGGEELRRFRDARGGLAQLEWAMLEEWTNQFGRRAYLHDPLTVACGFTRRFVNTRTLPVKVEVEGNAAGITRVVPPQEKCATRVEVCTEVDAAGFVSWYLGRAEKALALGSTTK